MTTNLVVLETYAEAYAERLAEHFSGLSIIALPAQGNPSSHARAATSAEIPAKAGIQYSAAVPVITGSPPSRGFQANASMPRSEASAHSPTQTCLALHPVRQISELTIPLAEVDILVTFGLTITDDILAQATGLEWIQSLATGVDHFLRSPALRPETILTSARGMHGPAMRETVVYLMLTLSHDTPRLMRQQAAHRWDRSRRWPLLAGKTALVVGTGVCGTAVAQLLQSLGMRVIGVSRTPRDAEGFDAMVAINWLAEAVCDADYLVNILPGDVQNVGVISADVFAGMKPSAFFVNVGRGETVDETALIAALRDGRIAGAGLDVFSAEPLPAGSPLWDLPNAVICPHIGGFFAEYEDYAMPILIENLGLFLNGRQAEMRNVVPHRTWQAEPEAP